MKKFVIFCFICVIFCLYPIGLNTHFYCSASNILSTNTNSCPDENFEFHHNNNVFTYNLNQNIPQSTIFSTKLNLNFSNRFTTINERKQLLTKLLQIGIDNFIAVEYLFPNLIKTIKRIEKTINKPAINAKVKTNLNTEKVFNISPEKNGIKLNFTQLINDIIKNYLNDAPLNFKIPTITLYPEITGEALKKSTYLRGDFSTNISNSNKERKHNIKNAINKLNFTEIYPNQEFSFNQTIGRRTKENGYKEAKIIVNNEFVEGFGGGVCQVSSTLYNTALLSGLEITESHKHSRQVSYVKPGFDAMVNYGTSDLKIKNNTNEKITIIANYTNEKIRIRIFGENNNSIYKLSNEILNRTEAKTIEKQDANQEYLDKVTFEDEYFFLKTPQAGMEIKSYLETYTNGVLQQKKLIRHDKFAVQDGIKIYGIKKRAEEENLHIFQIKVSDSLDKHNRHNHSL